MLLRITFFKEYRQFSVPYFQIDFINVIKVGGIATYLKIEFIYIELFGLYRRSRRARQDEYSRGL
ncbi:MAG: hypothetical protein DBY05_11880 [Clostridiales bacterium]|nr:MAG: hypothetical protein DBY05_11880 [Clostridiales bacterium]